MSVSLGLRPPFDHRSYSRSSQLQRLGAAARIIKPKASSCVVQGDGFTVLFEVVTPGTFAVKTAHGNHQLHKQTVGQLISLTLIAFRFIVKIFFFLIYKIFLETTATFVSICLKDNFFPSSVTWEQSRAMVTHLPVHSDPCLRTGSLFSPK